MASSYDLDTTIELASGEEVDVTVDYTVESWGSPGCGPSLSYPGDPPEPPEFGVDKITTIKGDEEIKLEDLPEATKTKLQETIYERICEQAADDSYGPDD
jgi:hypothetical protein